MVTNILLCDFFYETISSRKVPPCIRVHTADLQPLLTAHIAPTSRGMCWALLIQLLVRQRTQAVTEERSVTRSQN